MCDAKTVAATIDCRVLGEVRVDVSQHNYASVVYRRRLGTAASAVVTLQRAIAGASGDALGTPTTTTLNADTVYEWSIDVRDVDQLVMKVTTAASGVEFDAHVYMTTRE